MRRDVWNAPQRTGEARADVESESVSLTRSPGGEGPSSYSQTQVWDGTDHWTDDERADAVIVRCQNPWESVHFGPAPRIEALSSRCRTATVTGEEAIGGRDAWVLELSRPRCGASLPGNDGGSVLWIDRATGLLLGSRSYSASGRLWGETEITLLEINGVIDRLSSGSKSRTVSPSTTAEGRRRRGGHPSGSPIRRPFRSREPASWRPSTSCCRRSSRMGS